MSNMDKSVQHRSVLSLPVQVQQDTPKGSWVDATGLTDLNVALPLGVTEHDAVEGEMVAVTVIGTASMSLDGIASAQVMQGDAICYDAGSLSVKSATDAVNATSSVLGIVLYDAAATGHAEVLLR